MKHLAIVLLLATACGGKSKPTTPEPTASPTTQPAAPATLAEAVTYLCDAPARTKADPAYKQGCLDKGTSSACPDVAEQVKLLGKHVQENQTNPRVLDFLKIDGDQKGPELAKLVKEASIAKCDLQEVWALPAK